LCAEDLPAHPIVEVRYPLCEKQKSLEGKMLMNLGDYLLMRRGSRETGMKRPTGAFLSEARICLAQSHF
jgi:hypothetical protein